MVPYRNHRQHRGRRKKNAPPPYPGLDQTLEKHTRQDIPELEAQTEDTLKQTVYRMESGWMCS